MPTWHKPNASAMRPNVHAARSTFEQPRSGRAASASIAADPPATASRNCLISFIITIWLPEMLKMIDFWIMTTNATTTARP